MPPERLEATLEFIELRQAFRESHDAARSYASPGQVKGVMTCGESMAMDYGHAVYAGSFDPITLGHTAIIERASRVFQKVTVAIGVNPKKKGLFDVELREKMIKQSVKQWKNVKVASFDGLLIDYLKKRKAGVIIRGLRLL